ncbi:hypothetical protein AcV5_002645 [Taiwanofungus camphoratus]|nr:hypothetical protein AcV5_002645 [Antrodia cinnamomea]
MADSSTSTSSGKDVKLTQFKVLLFDVYGTLVDWETGIFSALQPLLARTPGGAPLAASKPAALRAFAAVEKDLEARFPHMRYADLLARVHAEMESRLKNEPAPPGPKEGTTQVEASAHTDTGTVPVGQAEAGTSAAGEDADEHTAFARSIARWAPFPDTVPALALLGTHYTLAVLSNVDRASFAATQRALEGPRVAFAAVYTAEDARAYKPDPAALAHALGRLEREHGVRSADVLVVANSVVHDVAPARAAGLHAAWIARRGSVIGQDEAEGSKAAFRFATLGEMAEAVRREAEGA